MTYLQAIILSIIEGLTEFLPVSSTGHLILASRFLNIAESEFLKSFEVIIQLGAIFAVVFLYKSIIFENSKLILKVIVAFLPAGFTGLILYKFIKEYLLSNELVTVVSLFTGGVILIIIEHLLKNKKNHLSDIKDISFKKSFFIGIFQSISIIPGISRAASTIIGGRLLGLNRETAVLFSFLLAIPTISAASIYDLTKNSLHFTTHEYGLLITGLACSFLVAYLTIKFFIKYIQNHSFISFGIYRIIIAILYWVFILR